MENKTYLDRITLVSGGQTGIDRATLDFCLDHGISCGGWCPEGRRAEDGTIHLKYPLKELPGATYDDRTAENVRCSDATVIIYYSEMRGGTLKSLEFARKEDKPLLTLDLSDLDSKVAAYYLRQFMEQHEPETINFSGPRKTEWTEGYSTCYAILKEAFSWKGSRQTG
jgi:hypothetical protein